VHDKNKAHITPNAIPKEYPSIYSSGEEIIVINAAEVVNEVKNMGCVKVSIVVLRALFES
tara:strand:+ start:369 stop:548 length:180 start_codon:yes stop_codon:yes gene_type:complete